MKKLNKAFLLITVAVGFMCSATSCPEEYTEWELFSIRNNSSDTIFVWDYLCKPNIDVLKAGYVDYKHPYYVIAPGERRDSIYMGIPSEDLNSHFKYKPEDDYSNEYVENIVILKKETYDKYSLRQLEKDKIHDTIYKLTKMEIVDMGYLVTYP